MTIVEVEALIQELRQKIPQLQMDLHRAEGYKQALVDMDKPKEEPEIKDTT